MGLSVWLDGDGKNALGELLMVPPPAVSLELAQQVAAQVYGWHAPVQPLSGERDRNFLVQVSPQTLATLKFINAAETRQETDVQVRVLEHLTATGCAIPTPVAVASAQGLAAFEWSAGEGECHRGRAYSFLRGVPMIQAAETPGLRRAVGRAAAQLAHSLADFAHPALEREFLWNVLHLGRLAPWAEALPADDVKAFVQRFMPHYEAQTLPRLRALPAQALHGDLSKSNLLVAPHDHEQVAGVLDFGDMVMAPRVVDLGIAASYLAEDTDTPMQALAEVMQGYEDIAPLRQEERDLTLDVVLARLVQRIVIPEWRARHFPENREYILRSNAQARRLLTQLMVHWREGWTW